MDKHIDSLRISLAPKPFSVIGLNETRLSEDLSSDLYDIDGYILAARKERNRHGGGTAIYISENLHYQDRGDLDLVPQNIEA